MIWKELSEKGWLNTAGLTEKKWKQVSRYKKEGNVTENVGERAIAEQNEVGGCGRSVTGTGEVKGHLVNR